MNLCGLFKSITLGTLFQTVIMLRIFLKIAVRLLRVRSFSNLKLIKNYLRSRMNPLRLRNLATMSIEQLADNINFDIVIEEFANK